MASRSSSGSAARLCSLLAGALGLVAVACSSSAESTPGGETKEDGGRTNDGFGPGDETPLDGGTDTCALSSRNAKRAVVDIIFVVDTSASMGDEIYKVRDNINTFAKSIGNTGLDYNVVMIGERGDPLGICVPPPLASEGCGDASKFHHQNVDINSWEILNVLLEEYATYSAWLRPEAQKVFIVVSDDDAHLGYEAFDKALLQLSPGQFGDAKKRRYVFNSIVGYTRGTDQVLGPKCGTAQNIGLQYQRLAQLTGGTIDSICEPSYASVFENITKGMLLKLGCEFEFPKSNSAKQTDPSRVKVTYTSGGGSAFALTQVTDASKCGKVANSWYYDNPSDPTKIIFCPSTCNGAGADPGGKLDVAVDCNTPPPK